MELLDRPKNFLIVLAVIALSAFTTTGEAKTESPTAQDQARGSTAEVEMTRSLRENLMKKDSLSTAAQNIKIITLNGVITLRGSVESLEEKNQIESIAKRMAGSLASVHSELQVEE